MHLAEKINSRYILLQSLTMAVATSLESAEGE